MTEFKHHRGELIKYHGNASCVVVPDGLTSIGGEGFLFVRPTRRSRAAG